MPKGLKGFQKGHKWRFKKGHVPSESMRKKISESNMGKPKSEEHKRHMSESRIGIKTGPRSEEVKNKIREGMKGKQNGLGHKKTEAVKKIMSEKQRGKKHHNWKNGLTPLVGLIKHCYKYRQWRSDIFTRDDFTCILCGVRSGNGKTIVLNADHYPKSFSDIFHGNKLTTIAEALNCNELWDISNGRTLCECCHKQTDNFGGKGNRKK